MPLLARWGAIGAWVVMGAWLGGQLLRGRTVLPPRVMAPLAVPAVGSPHTNPTPVGRFTAVRIHPVRAAVTGYVSAVYVREGDFVHAGQLLLKLYAVSHLPAGPLSPAFVTAPAAGVITNLDAPPGQLLRPLTQVATLHAVGWMRLEWVLPAAPVGVDSGTQVQVLVVELNDRPFTGHIQTLSAPLTHNAPWVATILVANTTRPYLLPGMEGRVLWPPPHP